MKRTLIPLVLILLLINLKGFAQQLSGAPPVILNPLVVDGNGNFQPFAYNVDGDQEFTLECGVNSIDIISRFNNVGTTDTYIVESIPYGAARFEIPGAGEPGAEIPVNQDDRWSAILPVGADTDPDAMEFIFFNSLYNQFIINTNGVVSFDINAPAGQTPAQQALGFATWVLANGDGTPRKLSSTGNTNLFSNAIFIPMHDIDPNNGDNAGNNNFVYWNILGQAPNRRFIIGINDTALFLCGNPSTTHQMIFYETTNIIEIHMQNKPVCNSWNGGFAVVGIQNSARDTAFTPPGRDTDVWTADFESWRFIPDGNSIRPTFAWYSNYDQVTNTGNFITADPQLTVSPTADTIYTAEVRYTNEITGEIVIETQNLNLTLNNPLIAEIVDNNAPNDPIETLNLCVGDSFTVLAQVESSLPNTTITYQWTQISNNTVVGTENTLLIDSNTIGATETYEVLVSLFNASNELLCTISDTVTVIVGDPSYNYPNTEYCIDTDTNPTPVNVTPAGGEFTINNGGVIIDATTGEIDLLASGNGTDNSGNFVITYTSGTPPNTCFAEFTINISTGNTAFTYDPTYCITGGNPIATNIGTTGGIFTIDPSATIDLTTGEIDINSLTAGSTYTVTYTTTGACGGSSEQTFTVTDVADPAFTYPTVICLATATTLLPDSITTSGGVFTISGSGVIDSATGNLTGSPAGTYDVTYTTVGCVDSLTIAVTVNAIENADFTFTNNSECAGDGNITPNLNANISNGGFTILPATIPINTTTGEITVDANITTSTTYTVTYLTTGLCPESVSQQITINPEDDATILYPSTTVCIADGTIAPNTPNTLNGVFSIDGIGVIDPTTGVVDLTASGEGTFIISYDTASLGNPCPNIGEFQLIISILDDTVFGYDSGNIATPTDFCISDAPITPNPLPGTSGGTYSINNGGVINTTTGEINITASGLGTDSSGLFAIIYETTGGCANNDSFNIIIHEDDIADFNYSLDTYCSDDIGPIPNFGVNNTSGGTFTIDNGGSIDQITGIVNLSNSGAGADQSGNFVITYTTNGICPVFDTFNIHIIIRQDATFTFPLNVCTTDIDNPIATNFTLGGMFTVNNGATINPTTGELILSSTNAGDSYIITYELPDPCGHSYPVTVNIVTQDDASFTYADTIGEYCNNEANPIPNFIATAGGEFTITNGGVIDIATGEINLETSGLGNDGTGNFNITYTTVGSCTNNSTISITIELVNNAEFEYLTAVCIADTNPTATNVNTSGGTFSVTNGATIDPITGELDLTSTTEGETYEITYSFGGNCPSNNTVQHFILINESPTANVPTVILRSCNNGNGTANFNISTSTLRNEILRSQTNVILTYHVTQVNAESGNNVIQLEPFAVLTGNDIWARVENTEGCFDIINISDNIIVDQCFLVFPEGFTPNNDNRNDVFTINDAEDRYIGNLFPNFEIWIYNRYGKQVYAGKNGDQDWNGKIDNTGNELPAGTYFFGLKLNDNQKVIHRGWVYLQR